MVNILLNWSLLEFLLTLCNFLGIQGRFEYHPIVLLRWPHLCQFNCLIRQYISFYKIYLMVLFSIYLSIRWTLLFPYALKSHLNHPCFPHRKLGRRTQCLSYQPPFSGLYGILETIPNHLCTRLLGSPSEYSLTSFMESWVYSLDRFEGQYVLYRNLAGRHWCSSGHSNSQPRNTGWLDSPCLDDYTDSLDSFCQWHSFAKQLHAVLPSQPGRIGLKDWTGVPSLTHRSLRRGPRSHEVPFWFSWTWPRESLVYYDLLSKYVSLAGHRRHTIYPVLSSCPSFSSPPQSFSPRSICSKCPTLRDRWCHLRCREARPSPWLPDANSFSSSPIFFSSSPPICLVLAWRSAWTSECSRLGPPPSGRTSCTLGST